MYRLRERDLDPHADAIPQPGGKRSAIQYDANALANFLGKPLWNAI